MFTSGDRLPAKCLRMDDAGQLPDCVQHEDGTWEAVYPSVGLDGGAFGALFLLALLVGLALTVWKVSTARRMARESGMSERDATTMALLTDDGFEATYTASSIRAGLPQTSTPEASTEARLTELARLRDQGLVTQDEYDAARRRILDGL